MEDAGRVTPGWGRGGIIVLNNEMNNEIELDEFICARRQKERMK